MKKIFMLLLLSITVVFAKAQRGCGYHHYQNQRHCGISYYPQQRYYSNAYYRRPLIDVVIAPRPRVIVNTNPQSQMVREWVAPHWEESNYGRVWVEGHYVQREIY